MTEEEETRFIKNLKANRFEPAVDWLYDALMTGPFASSQESCGPAAKFPTVQEYAEHIIAQCCVSSAYDQAIADRKETGNFTCDFDNLHLAKKLVEVSRVLYAVGERVSREIEKPVS